MPRHVASSFFLAHLCIGSIVYVALLDWMGVEADFDVDDLNLFFSWKEGGEMAGHYAHKSPELLAERMAKPVRTVR